VTSSVFESAIRTKSISWPKTRKKGKIWKSNKLLHQCKRWFRNGIHNWL